MVTEEMEAALSSLNLEIRGIVVINNLSRDRLNPECPYHGLNHFGPDDAHFFFGRDIVVNWLGQKVQRQSVIAVIGASGSGKSSVVLAGLAPSQELHQPGDWHFTHFRPLADPFYQLAVALVSLHPSDAGYHPFT